MNRLPNPLPLALCAVLGSSALLAQTPTDAPPWWGVQDDVTVSLYWDFANGSLQPAFVVAPPWYNPAITRVVLNGAAAPLLGNTSGHTDVLGFVGAGTGSVNMTVDNDPHLNWVKVFSFQADVFEGAGGSVVESIKQQLAKYDRSSVKWSSVSIGNGWETVTVQAQLIPQPDDEEIDWSMSGAIGATVAIDNVFVSSKCVKIGESDQDGDAMGMVVNGPIDLDALTANVPGSSVAAVVTEGPAPTFARTLWVAKRAAVVGTPHALVGTQGGAVTTTTALPSSVATSPQGPVDLAVETVVPLVGPHVQFVYALLDERTAPIGNLRIVAFDTAGVSVPLRDVVIAGSQFPSPAPAAGLAFVKSGQHGVGTFVVSDRAGNAFEFDRTGVLLDSHGNLPPQGRGLGYDPVFGRYYQWSDQPLATPRGVLQVNGAEISAYDHQLTGTRFFGDFTLPGTPLGGVAAGLEAMRSPANGRLRLGCTAITSVSTFYYELAAPFRYGASIGGVTGMQGLPFAGANTFTLTLSGVPTANFAALYVGFSNQVDLGTLTPLPFHLSTLGFLENTVLASLDVHSAFLTPTAPGQFAFTMPALPLAFRGTPMFFQWLELDPSAQTGLALSQAGKTILY